MRCQECRKLFIVRQATERHPYRYALSGLPQVQLSGIAVARCPGCHQEGPTIPQIGELHQQIAGRLIVKPGRLHGNEIRFLRKHAGWSRPVFAGLLRVSVSDLAQMETGTVGADGAVDQLIRALGTMVSGSEHLTRLVLLTARHRWHAPRGRPQPGRFLFAYERLRWRDRSPGG